MLLLTLALSGAAPATPPLEKTTWTLTQLGTAATSASSKAPTLQISGSKVSGFAGCNQYQATYKRTANRVSITKVVLTRRACEPALMKAENDFVQALGKVTTYRRTGQTLALYGGKTRLVFRADAPAPTAPTSQTPGGSMTQPAAVTLAALAGKWQVAALKVGGAVPVPVSAQLTLGVSGGNLSLSGKLDCNQITGQATLSGSRLTFSQYATTRMLCENMKGETALTKLLRTPVQISVKGDEMTWSNASGELTLRRAGAAVSAPAPKPNDLQGGSFTLRSISGQASRTERPITLSFEASKLSGDDACNTFFGAYSLTADGRLTVGSLASSYVMCPPNHPQFAALLMGRPQVTLSGNTLTLAGKEETWVFERR